MSKYNQHVVPNGRGWTIKHSVSCLTTGPFNTQKEAIEYARDLARAQRSELFIHGRDGKIRERNSYSR